MKTLQRDVFENDDNFYLRAPSYEDSRFVKENLVEWLISLNCNE